MYTDGGASGNPGPGGYGTLLMYGEHVKEMSEGFRLTTNNRMELLAVIVGLEALTRDGVEVDVYSDSKYVVDAVEKRWVFGWEKKGYKDKKNPDLWQRFLRVYRRHQVQFHWAMFLQQEMPRPRLISKLKIQCLRFSNFSYLFSHRYVQIS